MAELSPIPGGGRQSDPAEAAPSPPSESNPSTVAGAKEVLSSGIKRALEQMGDEPEDPKEMDTVLAELAEYPDLAAHERPARPRAEVSTST